MTDFKLPPSTAEEYTPEQIEMLQRMEADLVKLQELKKYSKLEFFLPYPRQLEHIEKGRQHSERLLMAGNQQGKTEVGAYELTCHLTGDYPDDWKGKRFHHPIKAWACAETATLARDVSQKKLCGEPGVTAEFGSGFIPRARFVGSPTLGHGATGGYDRLQVEHRTKGVVDGVSVLQFKSYEQGRAKFQGETLHVVWMDEQPPIEIYTECLARISATKGIIYVTFTNISGGMEIMNRFMGPDAEQNPQCAYTRMTIDDALHFDAEQRAKIISQYAPHERDARVWGFPMLGEGKVFTTPMESIKEPVIEEVPAFWPKIWGIDFGIHHPFAAALLAWDRDNDVLHLLNCFKVKDATVLQHCERIKRIAPLVPIAWPQDGTQRDRGDLKPFSRLYKEQGLRMIDGHATFSDGSVSTEAGIAEMIERFDTGRLRIASHLAEFFNEYAVYHRSKGLLVKVNDDILSATRVGMMMKRFARAVGIGPSTAVQRPREPRVLGLETEYWGID